AGHHQGAESAPAALPADRGLRALRPHRHRRAVGVHGPGERSHRGARLTRTVAVIPAGGAGTRLWPRSRRSTPKHALPLGGGGRALLRDTYDRVRGLAAEIYVVTELGQRKIIQAVLPEIDDAHLIVEPVARGTTNAYG